MKALLIALTMLAIAAPAWAQWTPADLPDVVMYMPTSDTSRMFVSEGVNATAAGDEILSINTPGSGGLILSTASGNRPFLRTDATREGSLDFFLSTANRYISADDASKAALKSFHASGTGTIMLWVKFDTEQQAATGYVLDCRNASSTNYGFSILRPTSERILFSVAAGSSLALLQSLSIYADTNWHSVVIRAGSGTVSMEVDGTSSSTALINPVDQNCTDNLRIGATSTGAASPMLGEISELVITSGTITDGERDQWLAYNPAIGDLTPAESSAPMRRSRTSVGPRIGISSNQPARKLIAVPDELTIAP